MAEEQGRWGYEIGPSDEMKKEIGQIVVNHAYCETALRGLLVAVAGWDEKAARIALKTFNPKGDPICKAIDLFLKATPETPEILRARIQSVIANYRELSIRRNMIAHWIWSRPDPESPQTASISNPLYGFAASGEEKTFTLQTLKEIGFGLAEIVAAAFLLTDFAVDPGRAPVEFQQKLNDFDEIMEKVKRAVLELPPAPEDEEHA